MAARRVSLPQSDDIFRRTGQREELRSSGVRAVPNRAPAGGEANEPSGRVRHDEKMTVYVTAAELLRLEQARLSLRADHGLAVDRGRLVREAIALALAELDEHGNESPLVRRLSAGSR